MATATDVRITKAGARGDVYVLSAGGILVPAGGTRGAGKVLTDQASGDPVWATPGGGGGGGGTPLYDWWDPFIPDASPHADADEFDDPASLSDFTGIYTGDTGVVSDIATTAARGMYFEAPSVDYRIRSRMKAIVAGDCTYHTAVAIGAQTAGSSRLVHGGLLLANGVTAAAGSQGGAFIGKDSGGFTVLRRLGWNNYGNDASGAAADTSEYAYPISFLRLRRVSTTYYMAVSQNGESNWVERQITVGFTPTHIGLGFQNYGAAGVASMTCYYFRPYATGTQYKTGASRTVTG